MNDIPEKRQNSVDPELVKKFIKDWDKKEADAEHALGVYRGNLSAIRNDQKAILDAAKDAGISKKAMKKYIDLRKAERQYQKKLELADLDLEQAETVEQISEALGDLVGLPLGSAVIAKVVQSKRRAEWNDAAPVRDLAEQAEDEEELIKRNMERLKGIKQLEDDEIE